MWEGGSNGLLGLYKEVLIDKSHCVDIDTILGLGLLVILLYVVVFIEGCRLKYFRLASK